ncbi:ABC transporter ATP-binding protein [Pseudoclavibacter soli]|uniref:ABC transporter ATP-binding protein n=1 Tax=Pseudoclavibacter soli TaxID=452623 RepID=UPI00146CB778|nr:ABC transporter ATP-binding protein [Pseudoclavibacter soli]
MANNDNEGKRKGFWHRRKEAEVVVEQVEGDLSAADAALPADAAAPSAPEEPTTPEVSAPTPAKSTEAAAEAGAQASESTPEPVETESAEQSGHVLTGFASSATPPETRPVYDAGQAAADAARIQKAVRVARPAGVPDPLPETKSSSAGIAPLPTASAQPEAEAQPQTQPNPTAAEEAALGAQIAKAVEPAPAAAKTTPAGTTDTTDTAKPATSSSQTADELPTAPEAQAAKSDTDDRTAEENSDEASTQPPTAVLASQSSAPSAAAEPATEVAVASGAADHFPASTAANAEPTAPKVAATDTAVPEAEAVDETPESLVAAAAEAAEAEAAATEAEAAAAHAHPLVVTPVSLDEAETAQQPEEQVAPLITERNVTVSGLRRSFGRRNVVLDGVGFTARSGQVTAIVGPNGSGKTTLLQVLATVLRPQEGDVRINGIDAVVRPQDVRTSIGWLTDSVALWPRLSVRKTLLAFSRLYGYSRSESRTRVDELLATLDLTDRAKTPARQLSRGERQLLGLARALVHDPQVLLLDEPTEALDARHRTLVLDLIRGLAGEGKTVIVATHDFDQLDACADNVVYLHDGRTATAAEIEQAQTLPRLWRIKTLDPAALLEALQRFDVDFSVDENSQSIEVFVDDEAQANLLLARLVIAGVPVHAFSPATSLIEQTYNVLSGTGPQPSQLTLLEQTARTPTAEVEIPEQPRRRGRRAAAHSTDTKGDR